MNCISLYHYGIIFILGTTNNFQHRGLIPRAISKLYRDIQDLHESDITVRVSYLEIYKERLYDLLSTISMENSGVSKMVVCENNQGMSYVKGLGCHIAKNEEDALNFLFEVRNVTLYFTKFWKSLYSRFKLSFS